MRREIVKSEEGSYTLKLVESDECYHSIKGPFRESNHIFVESGLKELLKEDRREINLLEVGFGTGLNCALTLVALEEYREEEYGGVEINYNAMELYPLTLDEVASLNYGSHLPPAHSTLMERLHSSPWESVVELEQNFKLLKRRFDLTKLGEIPFRTIDNRAVDLLYFDPFSSNVQPELWELKTIKELSKMMAPGGYFVTYSVKGSLRRALKEVGFSVYKREGPPGKREITVAIFEPTQFDRV